MVLDYSTDDVTRTFNAIAAETDAWLFQSNFEFSRQLYAKWNTESNTAKPRSAHSNPSFFEVIPPPIGLVRPGCLSPGRLLSARPTEGRFAYLNVAFQLAIPYLYDIAA